MEWRFNGHECVAAFSSQRFEKLKSGSKPVEFYSSWEGEFAMGRSYGLFAGSILFAASVATVIQPARGADFSLFGAIKSQTYVQNTPAATLTPQLDLFGDPGIDGFGGFLLPNSPGSVSSATITGPAPASVTLNPGNSFNFDQWYSSQSALNSAFPNGGYTLTANTADDGQKAFSLSLIGDAYPAAPFITNYIALQSANVSQPITLDWAAQPGGTAIDPLTFLIADQDRDTIYQSPFPNQPGALNGTDTSAVIPAGTLSPGQTYLGELAFYNGIDEDTTTYPGALALVGYQSFTDFYINDPATVPEPGTLAILSFASCLGLRRRRNM
jgi:hypothetical protein